jgi:dihydroneopterin aldolase
MNNQIFITNLMVPIIIGVPEWERAIKQNIFVDVLIDLKNNSTFENDSLTDTIDYAQVADVIRLEASENNKILLETFGEAVIKKLMGKFPIKSIQLKISKKKILADTDFVGVVLSR